MDLELAMLKKIIKRIKLLKPLIKKYEIVIIILLVILSFYVNHFIMTIPGRMN